MLCCVLWIWDLLFQCLAMVFVFSMCVSESDRPLKDQSEQDFDSRLIPLLRAELGLSSSDLFSMTVTDYDIKPKVGECLTQLCGFQFGSHVFLFSQILT